MSVTGTWFNVYGSTMVLTQNAATGAITGTYASSTGSTGTYNVVGFAMPNTPTIDAGEAFAIAIFWRSTSGTEDASWHWVSGLGGQVVSNGTTSWTLNLLHCMVATEALADGPMTIRPASYLDKLLYYSTPVAATAAAAYIPGGSASAVALPAVTAMQEDSTQQAALAVANPINGYWVCKTDSTLALNAYPE